MNDVELKEYTCALLRFFKKNGINEHTACAIMGNLICHLIIGDTSRQSFLLTLQHMWGITDERTKLN